MNAHAIWKFGFLFSAMTPARRRVLAMFCLLLPLVHAPLAVADTFRFGSGVIADGDSKAKVLQVAGEPESKKPVKAAAPKSTKGTKKSKSSAHAKNGDKDGGGDGEKWTYRYEGKLIDITLRNGVVTNIVTHRPR